MLDHPFKTVSNPGLHRITLLLDKLGNPQRDLSIVHIAGTNGKGSVCAFLQSILSKSGLRPGCFISPHLIRENERISVDGTYISDADLSRLLNCVAEAAAETRQQLGQEVTVFERYTAAAFCYFQEQNSGPVLLETGLGGRLDCTNVVEKPLVTVITRIDLDHQIYLGDTLGQIAAEKAGIIKPDGITVAAAQCEEALSVIRETAARHSNRLIITGVPENLGFDNCHERFRYHGLEMKSGLGGQFQPENAAMAVDTALALRECGIPVTDANIIDGINAAAHIGRFEFLSQHPAVLVDGAHNPAAAKVLSASLKRYYPDTPLSFVMGVMQGKDIAGMLDTLRGEGREFYAVDIPNCEQGLAASELYGKMKSKGLTAHQADGLAAAVHAAVKRGGVTVICGSLYLYEFAHKLKL